MRDQHNPPRSAPITRRELAGGLAGLTGLAVAGRALAQTPPPAAWTPEALADLQRYMKIYASLKAETVWYWYSGVMEMARPGEPVIPLVGVDTLIRRVVAPRADGTFDLTTWEANYFHAPGDAAPLETLVNPANGRTVRPFHFREGRRTSHMTPDRLKPFKATGVDSVTAFREAGPYTWLMRQLHIDVPLPLDTAKWPLEASGPRNQTGSFSTHCASTRDVHDPAVLNAPCSFNYEAIFPWLPWLLMGQTPGRLAWRANGAKFASLDGIPQDSLRGFKQIFPTVLVKGEPWTDDVLLWDDFQKQRTPTAR